MPRHGATWFRHYGRCACGKQATGDLLNSYNASMGPHCEPCANKKIKKAQEGPETLGEKVARDARRPVE